MPSNSPEIYVDLQSAAVSSRRASKHQRRSFARKQDRSERLQIDEHLDVKERIHQSEPAAQARDRGLDETLSDTFPCSDALSSIPNPAVESGIAQ
jgi:hypothetical protein